MSSNVRHEPWAITHRRLALSSSHIPTTNRPEDSLTAEHYMLAWSADGWRPDVGADDLLARP